MLFTTELYLLDATKERTLLIIIYMVNSWLKHYILKPMQYLFAIYFLKPTEIFIEQSFVFPEGILK